MLDVAVIEEAAAEATLDPIRARLLADLRESASAANVAGRLGLPRQKVNYHLHMLEGFGLLELVEERRRGNVTERVMGATTREHVMPPAALPGVAPDPSLEPNRLTARWMLALAARLVRDVEALITGAGNAKQRLAPFAMDGEVIFASAADWAAFTAELETGTAKLVEKYHSANASGGRKHRIVVARHPSIKPGAQQITHRAGTTGHN